MFYRKNTRIFFDIPVYHPLYFPKWSASFCSGAMATSKHKRKYQQLHKHQQPRKKQQDTGTHFFPLPLKDMQQQKRWLPPKTGQKPLFTPIITPHLLKKQKWNQLHWGAKTGQETIKAGLRYRPALTALVVSILPFDVLLAALPPFHCLPPHQWFTTSSSLQTS